MARSRRSDPRAPSAEGALRGAEVARAAGAEALVRYRWVAMGVVLVGSFMVILDTTIVTVALPQIGIDLHRSAHIDWIITAYLLAVGVAQPPTGWLSDRYGKKWIFVASLAGFTLGSLLSALAPNLTFLVVFRVLQGLGGGAMVPVGLAMIYELFPPDQRGTALGIWGVAVMAAPAIGPTLGGLIVTNVSWRWLFVVNVPIGIVGTVAAVRLLRNVGYREHRRLDTGGFVLVAVGLALLLLAFSEAPSWGWSSPTFLLTFATGAALVAAFVVRAVRIEHPLVELRLFRSGTFSLTVVVIMLLTAAQFGRLVFIPLELETLRHLTALDVGLILVPSALSIAATMPLGGRLADRIGARTPAMSGIALVCASSWLLGHLRLDTPLWVLIVYLSIGGLGNGLSMMPNTVTGMNAVETRYVAQASATRSVLRRVAASFGVAVLASLVAGRIGAVSAAGTSASPAHAQAAYNLVFLVAFGSALAGFVLAWWLPDRRATHALHAARAEEYEPEEMGL